MLSSKRAQESPSAGASAGNTRSMADWLGLAATPTFALMALLTAANASTDMACASMPGTFTLDGMVTMYLIMGAFHLPPWLRLLSSRSRGPTGGSTTPPHHRSS